MADKVQLVDGPLMGEEVEFVGLDYRRVIWDAGALQHVEATYHWDWDGGTVVGVLFKARAVKPDSRRGRALAALERNAKMMRKMLAERGEDERE